MSPLRPLRRYLSIKTVTLFSGRVVKPATSLTPKYLPTPRHKGHRCQEPWRRREGPGRRQEARRDPEVVCSLAFSSLEEMHITNLSTFAGFVMTDSPRLCDFLLSRRSFIGKLHLFLSILRVFR